MDEGLRPEDFRRAWPTALQRAMREAGELTHQIEQASEKVEAANRDALLIAELLPKMVDALRTKMHEEGDKLLQNSKDELSTIRDDIQALLEKSAEVEKGIAARVSELEKQAANWARQRALLVEEAEKRKKRWFHFFK